MMYSCLPDKLLHGGDYNPDQWLKYPEILEEDIRLMKKAHVNCVTLGVFSWAALEREEGEYDFSWLEERINTLYENGIYTILATPTGAMPHWLTHKYEEVRKMTSDGVRQLHGERHNFCPSSPVMRTKMKAINSRLSEKFGKHPGVIAWHISNEYGGSSAGTACHCPYCQAAFREWLKARYGDLETLNDAWWTSFWGNIYTDWEQIESPSVIGENQQHGLKLDWNRFTSEQLLDFCKEEVKAVRQYSDRPATVNMMGTFKPLDYFKWAKELDFVSFDNYPEWHGTKEEEKVGIQTAFFHTLTRSLKKAPFLLMESAPSLVQWKPENVLKRPGMHELSSLQAIAHGSDSVQYFQWRKGRGGCEKYHGAVLDHKNGENTRVFRDVENLGKRLENISDQIKGTCNKPKAAIVLDWENWWAVEDAMAVRNHLNYIEICMKYYEPFWKMGIDVDLIDMEDSLEGYSLIVAPVNYMYRDNYEEKVRNYVKNGGTYVTTYWSGEVNETDLCYIGKHPLSDVLGIRTEEIDCKPSYVENSISYDGKTYSLEGLCALIHAEDAEVLSVYEADFYKGTPALTKNHYGDGTAYFIAAETGSELIEDLYKNIQKETDIRSNFRAALPKGVTVSERIGEKGSVYFLQNYRNTPVCVSLEEAYREMETGEIFYDEIELAGYDCKILVKKDTK